MRFFESDFLAEFWEKADDAQRHTDVLTDELLKSVEEELGYKLPASYVELSRSRNGGIPTRCSYPMSRRTSWSSDHIEIWSIFAIGRNSTNSLCGQFGSKFWMEEWRYPEIGVYFADTPSGGHEMIALDYRECGPQGEPSVVYIDQENDYEIVPVAPTFESFVRGLVDESGFKIEE